MKIFIALIALGILGYFIYQKESGGGDITVMQEGKWRITLINKKDRTFVGEDRDKTSCLTKEKINNLYATFTKPGRDTSDLEEGCKFQTTTPQNGNFTVTAECPEPNGKMTYSRIFFTEKNRFGHTQTINSTLLPEAVEVFEAVRLGKCD